MVTLYTVGHSTRTIPEFVELLRSGGVDTVVDVRSIPRSRRNPDYNLDRLPGLLAAHGIGHDYVAELGGRRGRSHEVAPGLNAYWDNPGFHNYADHALSDGFAAGLDRLLEIAAERRCAIMCSEAVWWRCHRRIIADYLIVRGHDVRHLMTPKQVTQAVLTPGAVREGDRIVYPGVEP